MIPRASIVYRRTQAGTAAIVLLGAALAFAVSTMVWISVHPVAVTSAVVFTLSLALFPSLTVEVTDTAVRLRYGLGPIGRTFPLADIRSVRPVRNHWYYGWGIRWTPHGWLFNITGLDAVEIVTAERRTYRIGTGEPKQLASAIESARLRLATTNRQEMEP